MPLSKQAWHHFANYMGFLSAAVSNCLIAVVIILTSSCTGCSSLPSSSQPEPAALPGITEVQVRSFAELLQHIGTVPNERLLSELRYFISHNVGTETEKHKAAYVLARLLQKQAPASPLLVPTGKTNSIPPGSSKLPAQPDENNKNLQTPIAEKMLEEAVLLFEEASKVSPLWERSQWHIVEAGSISGNEIAVRKALDRLREKAQRTLHSIGTGTGSPRSVDSRSTGVPSAGADKLASIDYALAQSLVRTRENDKARELFEEVRMEAPESQYAIGSAYYLARLELAAQAGTARGQEGIDKALTLYRSYLKTSPGGRFAQEIVQSMTSLAQQRQHELSSEDHELIGRVQYQNGQWQNALKEWEQAAPGGNQFRKAICLANLGRVDDAVPMLLTAVKRQPESEFYSTAAEIVSRRLNRAKTLALWEQIFSLHPTHADHVLWNIAIRSDEQRAKPLLQQLLRNYPTSEYAPESCWWLFWTERNEAKADPRELRSALAIVDHALKTYPNTKYAAKFAFWSGKLNEQLKRHQEARAAYKRAVHDFGATYYGHRARYRLAALSRSDKTGQLKTIAAEKPIGRDRGWSMNAVRQEPDLDWSWPDIESSLSHEKTEQLYGATIAELKWLRQYHECLELLPNNARPELRAWLFAKLRQPLDAINASNKHLIGRPETSARWQFAYPLLYAKEVAQNAKNNRLDPLLVHALIREESRYNSEALSRSNAIGLMQLLKGTAYGVAKRIGLNLNGVDDIFVPSNNLKMGTGYLAYTLRRFDGNPLLAVASYNGGPGAVGTWYKKHRLTGSNDFDVFVENIPYRETRDYVKKVFGSYWTYELVYVQPRKL